MRYPLDRPIPWDFNPYPLYPPGFFDPVPDCACGKSGEDCGGECGVPSLLDDGPPFDPLEDA